jgi:hypothetical protein
MTYNSKLDRNFLVSPLKHIHECLPQHPWLFIFSSQGHDRQSSEQNNRKLISLHNNGEDDKCTRICRFLVVGNIFRLETCMNSLVKVPPYFKLNFEGKIFFTQNWCMNHRIMWAIFITWRLSVLGQLFKNLLWNQLTWFIPSVCFKKLRPMTLPTMVYCSCFFIF